MKVVLTMLKVGGTLAFVAFCLFGLPIWIYSLITDTHPVDYMPNYKGEVAIEAGYFSPFEIIGIGGCIIYAILLILIFAWPPAKEMARKVWDRYYWNYDDHNPIKYPRHKSSQDARRKGMKQGERFLNTTTKRIEEVT